MISSNQINHLIEVLETGHAKADPGWPIQPILGEVLINMAERILALENQGGAINTTPYNDKGEIEYVDGVADEYIDVSTIEDIQVIRIKT